MNYFLWVPILIVYGTTYSLLSKYSNESGGYWMWAVFLWGIMGPWFIFVRYSQHLIFDGMLYDMIITVTYVGTMLCLGVGKGFSIIQYIGSALVIVGFIMMKWKAL